MSEQDVNSLLGGPEEPRPPSMLDAVIPVVALIGLIALSVYLFGLDSTNGALQVGLFTAMSIAGLIAHKNGHSYPALERGHRRHLVGDGRHFILLAVGALIGTWNMAGTIPTIVDYGLRLLDPNWFYPWSSSSAPSPAPSPAAPWTTAGTLGVSAFVGIAQVMGLSPEIAAGAVILGAYFGDKMSPLSETTILVPSLVGGVTTAQHIRAMAATVVPSILISLVLFFLISLTADVAASTAEIEAARATMAEAFAFPSSVSCRWCY